MDAIIETASWYIRTREIIIVILRLFGAWAVASLSRVKIVPGRIVGTKMICWKTHSDELLCLKSLRVSQLLQPKVDAFFLQNIVVRAVGFGRRHCRKGLHVCWTAQVTSYPILICWLWLLSVCLVNTVAGLVVVMAFLLLNWRQID